MHVSYIDINGKITMDTSPIHRVTSAEPEDGPEEGEIVSDDLEDISDESIVFTPCNGKSLSRSDHLHDLSLSSISDLEDTPVEKRRKRKRSYSQRHHRRRKRSRRKLVDSDSGSSDDETTLGRTLKLQLKAAVRVDIDDDAHKNSLRTRLRAMVCSASSADSDNDTNKQKREKNDSINIVSSLNNSLKTPEKDITVIEIDSGTDSLVSAPEIIPIASEVILSGTEATPSAPENIESGAEQSKDDIDAELIHLRIEALKTAINNKFAKRKRQKKENTNNSLSDDTNKENTDNNGENQGYTESKNKVETRVEIPQISPQLNNDAENIEPASPEEDEDVMRALLLASMSKKITNIEPEPTKTIINKMQANSVIPINNKLALNKKINNINTFKLSNVKKFVSNDKNPVKASAITKLIKMPPVKPLIIQVNSDSDSDLDLSSSPEKSPKKFQKIIEKDTDINSIKNNITKTNSVEANKVAQNIEATIETSVEKFLREQRAKVESEIQSTGAEMVTNIVETQKLITTTNSVASNNIKNTSRPTVVIKSTHSTKQITLGINKIIPNKNRTGSNVNKIISYTNVTNPKTVENGKNLKIVDLDKSALKFLPENKREEYRKLQNLLRLKKAQQLRKPRVRRASQKNNENNLNNSDPKKIDSSKTASETDKNELITKITPQTVNVISSSNTKVGVSEVQINNPTVNSSTTPVISTLLPTTLIIPKANLSKTKLVNKTLPKGMTAHPEKVSEEVGQLSRKVLDKVGQLSKNEVRNQEYKNEQLRMETQNQERKSDAFLLHTTLKQMQTRKDGRLQIQERFKSLRPLVKKINEVSKEQKNWDQHVKKLLEQLTEARKKQQEVQQNMSMFVRELADRKQKIDDSLTKISSKPKTNNLITSTPLKQNASEKSFHISSTNNLENSTLSGLSAIVQGSVTNTENMLTDKNKNESSRKDENLKTSSVPDEKDKMLNTWEQSTKVGTEIDTFNETKIVINNDLNVVDPNDIDGIIKKTEEKVAWLEKKESFECRRSEKVRYISPLDPVKRKENFDPFAIMCPFEVNGTCRDPECTFKHLPK